MSNTDQQLQVARDNQLNRYLDGLSKNEKLEEKLRQEAVNLTTCRLEKPIDAILSLRAELTHMYPNMDAKELIFDELDAWL